MCGVHLIIDKVGVLDDLPIKQMMASSAHRGPDGQDFIKLNSGESQLFLGFNYLNITTATANALQPFSRKDTDAYLLFNGEIYNAAELKNELIKTKKYEFESHSDTEVLYYHLLENGEAGLAKLKGMFALVWINLSTKAAFMARDESGQKPLYFSEHPRFFVASSELRAIKASGLVNATIDYGVIPHLLRYKYVPTGKSIYQNIQSLPPSHVLQLDKIPATYSKFTTDRPAGNSPSLSEVLTDSVLRHIPDYSSWGIFASGGLDSTLLMALLHKEHINPPAFYIHCEGLPVNHLVEKAAKQYGAELVSIHTNANELVSDFDHYIAAIDQPIADSAAYLTWKLSAAARSTVKSIWTGAGADELFAGYRRHWAFYKYLTNPLVYHAANLIRQTPLLHLLPSSLQKLAADVHSNPFITFQNFSSLYCPELPAPIHFLPQEDHFTSADYFQYALNLDRSDYLVNDILLLNDQMGMQFGLEMRAPFLFPDVVDFVNKSEPLTLINKGNKWMLKNELTKLDGAAYVNQQKAGFGLPFGKWLQQGKATGLLDYLHVNNSPIFNYIDKNIVSLLTNQHLKKKKDHGPVLWSLITTSAWLQKNK